MVNGTSSGSDRRTTRPPDDDERFPVALGGVAVDPETRCAHYDTDRDVIAIRFACCDRYYPCFRCHDEVADHEPERIPRSRFDAPAVLCGVCGATLPVADYLSADDTCPNCAAPFNPGCRRHHDRYFEV